MSRLTTIITTAALVAGLAGCNRKPADTTEALDKELVGNVAGRPSPSGDLGNQIVVDPALAGRQQALGTSPATPGETAAQAGDKCDFAYDAAWARRLPVELPVYPGARITEAAGSDAAGCKRRIVSFTAAAPVASVIDFYRSRVTRAGYSVEHLMQKGSDVLGGTRGDAAYYINVSPSGAGAAVDLVSNEG